MYFFLCEHVYSAILLQDMADLKILIFHMN